MLLWGKLRPASGGSFSVGSEVSAAILLIQRRTKVKSRQVRRDDVKVTRLTGEKGHLDLSSTSSIPCLGLGLSRRGVRRRRFGVEGQEFEGNYVCGPVGIVRDSSRAGDWRVLQSSVDKWLDNGPAAGGTGTWKQVLAMQTHQPER